MASFAFSLLGWTYLPDFATRRALPYFHRFYQNVLHRPIPAPNTPAYVRHYRYVYAVVVMGYLFYNFREAALSMPSNYYEILDVNPTADDNALKTAFRQFAKKYHPDRVGAQGEALFMEVRNAYDALKDPITRFAYDRFGPDALHWQHCKTLRDYLRHGLMQSAGFYIVSACVLFLLSAMGQPSPVAFWRYLLLAALLAYELAFLLGPSPSLPSNTTLSSLVFTDPASPSHSSVFTWLWPRRVAYQHIRFLHSLSMLLSVALSKVAPVLFPSPPGQTIEVQSLINDLARINAVAAAADQEASAMIQIELHSAHGEPTGVPPTGATFPYVPPCNEPAEQVMNLLSQEIENMVIEGKILRESGPMKSLVDTILERRRNASRNSSPVREPGPSSPASPALAPMSFSTPSRIPSSPSRRAAGGERRPFGSPVPSGSRSTRTFIRARSRSLSC